MGYTHYWDTSDLDADVWKNEFVPGVMAIIAKSDVPLAGAMGEGEPTISDTEIALNGKSPDDYESFVLALPRKAYGFTKTQYRPYDKVVVAILMLAKQCFGDAFSWSSDGDASDHAEGASLLHSLDFWKRNEAEKFLGEPNNFRDTGHVMSCLDDRGLTKQQDWREGITIWKFADQSAIKVEGSDVSVLDPEETAQQWGEK